MALVAADDRDLVRAAGAGRVRDAGLRAWEAVRLRPGNARAEVDRVIRAARGLHSAERRLVKDVVFGFVRDAAGLGRLLGTEDPIAWWTGELVLRGLVQTDPPFADLAARWEGRGDDLAPDDRLALRHSVPVSAVERLRVVLGDDTERFLVASDVRAPLAVRANRTRCTREELAARLVEEGIQSTPSRIAPDGLVLEGRPHLPSTRVYRAGWLEVMDEGSQRVAALAEGDGPVVDACAGAGGKSLALARAGRRVVALDIRPRALDELRRRAARAGVRVEPHLVAAEGPLPPEVGPAPTVLVDAPCSGSGVLRRDPARRATLDDSAVAAQGARQKAILARMASLVLPGGRLVYATCSVFRDENEDIVASFLQRNPGFRLRAEERWWPHLHGTDGFYAAVLDRPRAPVGATG